MKLLYRYRNHLSIFLVSSLIIVVPLANQFVAFAPYLLIGIPLLLALVAFRTHAWFDAKFYLFLSGYFLLVRVTQPTLDPVTFVFRSSALLAFGLLHVVLLIGPWARFSKWVRKQYKHRRRIGVTVFFLGATHAAMVFTNYFSYSVANALQAIFVFFGMVALYILTVLALTSWDWLQLHVTKVVWSVIYSVVLVVYAGAMVGFFRMQPGFLTTADGMIAGYLVIAFLVFGLLAAPYSVVRFLFYRVNGWKQVHVLIYVAYVSLLFHSWGGYFSYQPTPIQWGVIASMVAVFGSHGFGWVRKWQEDARARNRVKLINAQISQDGKTYIGVAKTDELNEGKGVLAIIDTIPIALFAFKGGYYAITNICGHQKGPLSQGTVTPAGYVTCPWHQYQYSVKDGTGPPGYKDSVPRYDTLVKDSVVYVNVG